MVRNIYGTKSLVPVCVLNGMSRNTSLKYGAPSSGEEYTPGNDQVCFN